MYIYMQGRLGEMAAASASSPTIAAIYSSNDGHIASSSSSSKAAFFPAHAMLGGRRLSSSPSTSTITRKFGSVLSLSTKRSPKHGTPIDPEFYKIPYVVEGIPVGNRLKLWNLPPNCDQGELRKWLDSIPDVNVTALEFTDDPELDSQGVGGFVEYTTKQEAWMAIVWLDGRKFKGRCIRMDFVEKRPLKREIGGCRNRPSRNYSRDRSSSGSSYSGGGYASSTYAGSNTGVGMYEASNAGTSSPSGSTFNASMSAAAPNWAALPSPPPRAYGRTAHHIFVGNLSWNMDDYGLFSLFQNHGNVLEVGIMHDRETGRFRGFGFVAMSSAEEMNAAIAALDGTVVDGRPLQLSVLHHGCLWRHWRHFP